MQSGQGGARTRGRDLVASKDTQAGFEVRLDRQERLIRMRLWGHWSAATCQHFCETMVRFAGELQHGPRWAMLTDSREFPAQTQEVTRMRQEAMVKLARMGCAKLAAIAHQPVYAMQLRRIADPSGLAGAVFADEASALAWLAEGEPQPR